MTTNPENNKFIEKTIEALDINEKDQSLGIRGFEFDNSTSEKDCVLVIGLDPAGNEKEVNNIKISSCNPRLFK